jgi:GNAT superfamily N-acetyltransferase
LKTIEIDPSNSKAMKQFIELPFRLYRQTPQWTPPLRMEARQVFDRRKNPIFRYGEATFFLLVDENGVAQGRIAVLNNHRFNEYNGTKSAFFYLFECENDIQIAEALFDSAFDWARRHGLEDMLGPKGFSPFDGMGLLVQGFEHRPAFGIPYNLPYYANLLEAVGFAAQNEIVSGYLSGETRAPEKLHRLAERVRERRGLEIARFQRRKDLELIVPQLADLYNATIDGTTDNYPVTKEEAQAIARQMLAFSDPRLIKVVLKEKNIVGFLFAYPDVSPALQRSKGRLFPLGWAYILLEMRRRNWLNVNGMGILPEYRGLGGTAILFSELQKSVIELGYKHADLVQIGADNERMLRELESFGVDFYKKHCMYRRLL